MQQIQLRFLVVSGGVGIAKSVFIGNFLGVLGPATFNSTMTFAANTDAFSSITGSATFAGGVGIAKSLFVGTVLNVASSSNLNGPVTANSTFTSNGLATFTNTTDASSPIIGSVVVAGGLSTAKGVYVGSNLAVVANAVVGGTCTVTGGISGASLTLS